MALKRGNGASRRQQQDRVPYYDRLEPIEFEYGDDDKKIGELRVFDDRKDEDIIHVQFRQELRKGLKVAVFHMDEATLVEFLEDLDAVREELGL